MTLKDLTLHSSVMSGLEIKNNTKYSNSAVYIRCARISTGFDDGNYVVSVDEDPDEDVRYLCLSLDPEVVIPRYVAKFLSSNLGYTIFRTFDGEKRFYTNRSGIDGIWLFVPDLAMQKHILSAVDKIAKAKSKILDFDFDNLFNPLSLELATSKVDKILEIFGELADYDRVKALIAAGESKTLEFKQTLSLDIKKGTREKYIEEAAIKTVAALLNSDGGVLLVGIGDGGAIAGVDGEIAEFHKNTDRFLLHFKNLIKFRIGEQSYPFINQRLVNVDSKWVLFVECLRSGSEVYVDDKDFYVRTNPATDKLEGPKLVAYIRSHFKTV